MYRAEVLIPLGLAFMIVQGLLFAWLYPQRFSTARDDWAASAHSVAAASL
jgi:hypothetical protein